MTDYLQKNPKRRQRRARLKAILRRGLFAILAFALLGVAGFWIYTGWRARDLALKARENLENANYRLAWVQASSARDLRPSETEVLRTSAIIDAAFGRRESLDYWRQLARLQELTDEDHEQRARAAMRFGDTAEFEAAVDALQSSGRGEMVARLRATEQLNRGDLDTAIEEARRGAALTENVRLRLDLARLLLQRYADELVGLPKGAGPATTAFREMTAIVNSLEDHPEVGLEALGFGLTFLIPSQEIQKRWADLAMDQVDAENIALLPAATVLVNNKHDTAKNLHNRLRPVFDGASLEHRAAYVAWLTRHGMPDEALTMITAQEAAEGKRPFLARAAALGALRKWPAVIASAEAGGNVPTSILLLTKARAEYALRANQSSAANTVAAALRAAVREGTLPSAVKAADEFGARSAVSDSLVELSGDPAASRLAFRLARARFAVDGDHARLQAAYEMASATAPEDVAVRDYARYTELITGADVRPDLEGAALDAAAEPGNQFVRITQSLALMRSGEPQKALEAFKNITIFYDRLPPGPQAVVCAVLSANGETAAARAMAAAIDVANLHPGEKALLNNLR